MIKKSQFLSKCEKSLLHYMSSESVLTALDEMDKIRLKDIQKSDTVSDILVDECLSVLFARVRLFKGYDDAENFLKEMEL